MWWLKRRTAGLRLGRLAVALATASLAGGCFQPLYATHPAAATASIRDRLAAVDIAPVTAPRGTPSARLAVELRNDLQFEFNGGAGANAPLYRLVTNVSTSTLSVIVDITSGRPDAEVDSVNVGYQLVEIATGKVVVNDSTFSHVDFDIPGSAQRFAKQRAQRDAEDRATQVIADNIRNRLASYFVAGT
jgi:LPS-assembly lipoprotein